jgi:hypothetical protein
MTKFAKGEFIYLEFSPVFAPLVCLSLCFSSVCVSVPVSVSVSLILSPSLSLSFSPHPHLFLSPSLSRPLSLLLHLSLYIGPEMGDKIYQEATELEEKLKKEDEEANPEAYVLCFLCSPCLLLPLACACHPQLWLWK